MTQVATLLDAYGTLSVYQGLSLMVFIILVLLLIGWFFYMFGIETKWFKIGGQRKESLKTKEDLILKEKLKNKTDAIDLEAHNNLYDIARNISRRFAIYLGAHCYFTLYVFADTFRDILKSHVRHNNFKIKLMPFNKDHYIRTLETEIRSSYFETNIRFENATSCQEVFPTYKEIQDIVLKFLGEFYDESYEVTVNAIKQKIDLYENMEPKFQIPYFKQSSCTEQLERNREYLANLKEEHTDE